MKKILVPVDFSEPSIEAFQLATNLANKSGGSVTVLHVVDLPVMAYGPSIDMPVYLYDLEILKDLKKSAIGRYNQMAKKYSKGFKRLKFSVEQGPTFSTIKDYVKNKRFDLVVMGTHGATGLKEFFIGSNTEKVVRFSKAPVLAIRKAIPISSIKNIVYPTSLQSGQSEFIKKLKALQQFFGAKLHVLFLNTPFNFIRDNELKEFAKRHQLSNYSLNIRNDRYEPDGIVSFAEEVKADMLAMPTHARKGLAHFISGSVTEDVVNHILCPIWTYAIKD
jgi:nucleotide-binding universal stress UspA family protein